MNTTFQDSTNEKQFLLAVTEEFQRAGGWLVLHIPDAWLAELRKAGIIQRFPILGDLRGFPDLLIVGHGQTIFAELKTATGTLEPEQELWRDALLEAGQTWFLWRPKDRLGIAALAWAHRQEIEL